MNQHLHSIDPEVGATAGYWHVAEDGHIWIPDLRLSAANKGFVKGAFGLRLPAAYDGPWLLPKNNPMKRYSVLRSRDVLHDFVRLAKTPEQKTFLGFADKWGQLGGKFPVVDPSNNLLLAEPLMLWEEESCLLATLWQTWDAVRTLSTKGMPTDEHLLAKSHLQDRVIWTSANRVLFSWPNPISRREVIAYGATPQGLSLLERWKAGDTIEPARFYVHKQINRCLNGHVQMQVATFQNSKIRFVPDSLRTAIYMHFAFELAGTEGNERTCLNPRCPNGGVFFPTRRDKQYCDTRCRDLAGYHRRKNAN
ncbi:MAG: hypothetical protein O2913_09860 [Chloroflexi bacterium]|nr:hypothetical protein [Chloroflexota bacterium]